MLNMLKYRHFLAHVLIVWTPFFFCAPALMIASPGRGGDQSSHVIRSGRVEFRVESSMGMIRGSTSSIQGTLRHSSGTGQGEFVVDTTSFDTGSQVFNKFAHEDILESQRFPRIALKVAEILPDQGNSTLIRGEVTFHGVSKSVEIPCSSTSDQNALRFSCDLSLRLTDYGSAPFRIPLVFDMEDRVDITFDFAVPGLEIQARPSSRAEYEYGPADGIRSPVPVRICTSSELFETRT